MSVKKDKKELSVLSEDEKGNLTALDQHTGKVVILQKLTFEELKEELKQEVGTVCVRRIDKETAQALLRLNKKEQN